MIIVHLKGKNELYICFPEPKITITIKRNQPGAKCKSKLVLSLSILLFRSYVNKLFFNLIYMILFSVYI